ncbi:UDP-N-acetylglucosamine transferase subunit ALG13 [Procambarus clarkii]|uniref:UDP-N-acetylglucosamine transferase subunit ALG13 n=1 Tax=Procambarus clarkii TaxID=6728 RepID=UPI001E67104B|nr:UDP-N-acetylglucosamine transferase subunit ALG13 homolog [Procambarus clarkii]
MEGKTIFVTVGTTRFDALVRAVVEEDTLAILREKGYNKITFQIGQGEFVPPNGELQGITLTHFRLKPSIAQDFAKADLVISHAGAGSCLEALGAGKPLVAVVNDALMDNHQSELAEQLADIGFCFFCYPYTLQEKVASMDITQLRPYVPGQPSHLAQYLASVIKVTS